jgi:hypothetical protein
MQSHAARIFVRAKIENPEDLYSFRREHTAADRARALVVDDAMVDTTVTELMVPSGLIAQLGLRPTRTQPTARDGTPLLTAASRRSGSPSRAATASPKCWKSRTIRRFWSAAFRCSRSTGWWIRTASVSSATRTTAADGWSTRSDSRALSPRLNRSLPPRAPAPRAPRAHRLALDSPARPGYLAATPSSTGSAARRSELRSAFGTRCAPGGV